MKDHSNFVSSVCVFNNGKWLATASNDKTICIYLFGIVQPFATLKDHTNTVCTLAQGLQSNILVSGSWDQTARIWTNLDVDSTSIELKGHEAAVWAVATLKNEKYATGSADKNIIVWNSKGEKLVVLKGHTDCVRGLVGLLDGSLLSCSNDATIRHWSDTYDCLKEFHGHSNYIYSIALNPFLGNGVFVTGGEDSTVRLWSVAKGALGDALTLPVQSIWAIACTDDGDIVTGTNDGVVRVFSKDPYRFAPTDALNAFNVAIETRKLEQTKELGGVKVNDLPGPESLLQEGTEGQTRLVRQPDGKIMCYQWTKGKWECVGDVMGASGGTKETSCKSLFDGKEYDFVFNVDIEDGAPALKLPFNKTDDPWMEAQKFIHKHDLPQVYLEQVANFIITNANLSSLPPVAANEDFVDPFTGGGRYVPSASSTVSSAAPSVNVNFRDRSNQSSGMVNMDPFTGGSSYSSGQKEFIVQKHIPLINFITFDVYDGAKILMKLKEFNEQINEQYLKMTEEMLEKVVKLADSDSADTSAVDSLKTMLKWPKEKLFPVLDVIRLAVRYQGTCTLLGATDFVKSLVENLTTTPANQLMSIRALNNMMIHGWGRGLVETKINEIIEFTASITQGTVNLQIAIATFFLNQSIAQKEIPSDEICTSCCIGAIRFLEWTTDPESRFRTYQSLGNLIVFNSSTTLSILKTVDSLKTALEQNKSSQHEKLAEISTELSEKLL